MNPTEINAAEIRAIRQENKNTIDSLRDTLGRMNRTIDNQSQRIRSLVSHIAGGTETAKCSGCKAPIVWLRTRGGKNTPVDLDGTPHWATCQQADLFRNRGG